MHVRVGAGNVVPGNGGDVGGAGMDGDSAPAQRQSSVDSVTGEQRAFTCKSVMAHMTRWVQIPEQFYDKRSLLRVQETTAHQYAAICILCLSVIFCALFFVHRNNQSTEIRVSTHVLGNSWDCSGMSVADLSTEQVMQLLAGVIRADNYNQYIVLAPDAETLCYHTIPFLEIREYNNDAGPNCEDTLNAAGALIPETTVTDVTVSGTTFSNAVVAQTCMIATNTFDNISTSCSMFSEAAFDTNILRRSIFRTHTIYNDSQSEVEHIPTFLAYQTQTVCMNTTSWQPRTDALAYAYLNAISQASVNDSVPSFCNTWNNIRRFVPPFLCERKENPSLFTVVALAFSNVSLISLFFFPCVGLIMKRREIVEERKERRRMREYLKTARRKMAVRVVTDGAGNLYHSMARAGSRFMHSSMSVFGMRTAADSSKVAPGSDVGGGAGTGTVAKSDGISTSFSAAPHAASQSADQMVALAAMDAETAPNSYDIVAQTNSYDMAGHIATPQGAGGGAITYNGATAGELQPTEA